MSCEKYTSQIIYNGADLSQEFPNIGEIELKSCEDLNQIIFDLWSVLITVGTGTIPPLDLVMQEGSNAQLVSEFAIDGDVDYGTKIYNQKHITLSTKDADDQTYDGSYYASSNSIILSANSVANPGDYNRLQANYNGVWEISFGSTTFADYTEAVRLSGTDNALANKGYVDYVISNLPTALKPKGSIGAVSGNDLPTTGMMGGDTYWCDSDGFVSTVTGQTYNRGDMIIWSEIDSLWFCIPSTDAEYANKTLNETITGSWSFTNGVTANFYFGDGSNLTGVAKPSDIPTLVSELTNDVGYITTADLAGYLQSGDNVSELVNDAGYLVSADLSGYLQSGDNISELANNVGYITGITGTDVINALGYTPANVTAIPTLLSELTNDVGYITGITGTDVINALGYTPANTAALSAVAFSGSYSDLSGAPTVVSAFINDAGYLTSANLTGYLPLTAGNSKAISGALYKSDTNGQILKTNNSTRMLVSGGSQASTTSGGAYIILEGKDYGGTDSGGDFYILTPSFGKAYYNSQEIATVNDLSGYLPLTGGSGNQITGDVYFQNAVYLRALTTGGASTRIHGIDSNNTEWIGSVDEPIAATFIGNNTNNIRLRILNQNRFLLNNQQMSYMNSSNLGTTAGDYKKVYEQMSTGNSNNFYVREWVYRDASGSDWLTVNHINGISIDSSFEEPTDSRCYWRRDPQAGTHLFADRTGSYLFLSNGGHTMYRQLTMGYSSDSVNRPVRMYTSGDTWASTGGSWFTNKVTGQSAFIWLNDSNQLILQNSSTSARDIILGKNNSPVYATDKLMWHEGNASVIKDTSSTSLNPVSPNFYLTKNRYHHLVCTGSGTVDVYLPSSPRDGEVVNVMLVIGTGTDVDIHGNGNNIIIGAGDVATWNLNSSSSFRKAKFIFFSSVVGFTGGRWFLDYQDVLD